MKRNLFVFALLLLSFLSAQGQQQTVDRRLQQLEEQVQEINRRLGIQPVVNNSGLANVQTKYGQPGCKGQILPKPNYIICYLNSYKDPLWVAYRLTAADLTGGVSRKDDFRPDAVLPEGQRAELSDYRGSGFDRGHMAPAADFKRSATAMSDTFVLSNMTPQTPNVNRITWEHLEEEIRTLAQVHGQIWIVTGALFLDSNLNQTPPTQFIGKNRVAVPSHLYKVILCEHKDGSREMFAFVVPNQRERLSGGTRAHITTVRYVEQISNLDFFSELPKPIQDQLETVQATNWPVQSQ